LSTQLQYRLGELSSVRVAAATVKLVGMVQLALPLEVEQAVAPAGPAVPKRNPAAGSAQRHGTDDVSDHVRRVRMASRLLRPAPPAGRL
jgi:hypothetical protein